MSEPNPDANRQLPREGEIFLDHVAHFVPDAGEASRAMAGAGFAPTPISIQTNPGPGGTSVPAGTGNITAMMTRGYIEVLFKTAETALAREFDASLGRYSGLHLLAFSVADARAASLALAERGFRTASVVALRRPVTTATGHTEAAFTVARVLAGEMAEGRVQFLTHHTEDAVWQNRWLRHPNGATELLDVAIVVADAGEASQRYSRFLGRPWWATGISRAIFLDRGSVQLFEPRAFARLVPGLRVPALPFIALYAIRVESLVAAARLFSSAGMRFEQRDRMLFVMFPDALGTGAWVFVEEPADLPWRPRS